MTRTLAAQEAPSEVSAKSLCPQFEGTPHVAVDDAINQARWLQAICNTFDLNL